MDQDQVKNVQSPSKTLKTKRRSLGPLLKRKPLTNDQLSALYSNCIKLCTQNKVTPQNAWNLNLIDYITDVIKPDSKDASEKVQDGESTDFTRATATLDASVQIYSCRVDSVHNTAYKILGGLSNANEGAEDDRQDDISHDNGGIGDDGVSAENKTADGEAKGEEQTHSKSKPKTKKGPVGVCTLEQNEDAITMKSSEKAYRIDPNFKETTSIFNRGGARGLLLNYLKLDTMGKLIFDYEDYNITPFEKEETDTVADTLLFERVQVKLPDDEFNAFCPSLEQFSIDGKPLNGTAAEDRGMVMKLEDVDLDKVIEEQKAQAEEIAARDEDNLPVLDLDNILADDGCIQDDDDGNNNGIANIDVGEGKANPTSATSDDIPRQKNFRASLARGDDYSYFDPLLIKNWTGSSHWKYQAGKQKKVKNEEDSDDDTNEKKKKTKKNNLLDFSSPNEEKLKELFSAPAHGTTLLSSAALKKQTTLNTTMPPDEKYKIKMLTTLFTKPSWVCEQLQLKREREENVFQPEQNGFCDGDGIEDPSGDAFDFGPMLGLDALKEKEEREEKERAEKAQAEQENQAQQSGQPEGSEQETTQTNLAESSDTNTTKENASNVPEDHAQAEAGTTFKPERKEEKAPPLNYAKIAKSIDVSLLKEGIWRSICRTESEPNRREFPPGSETNFQTVLDGLEFILPKSMLPDLSIAMCYICLLHLCNDKGLLLRSEDNMRKLRIMMPEKE